MACERKNFLQILDNSNQQVYQDLEKFEAFDFQALRSYMGSHEVQ